MATGGHNEVGWNLVHVGNLKLERSNETPGYEIPKYISIVISQNKIIVVDYDDFKVKIHRLHDGKFLDMLDSDSRPRDICLMDATTICVLHLDGLIEMVSIKSKNISPVFTRMKNFRLDGVFDRYESVVRVNDNIVVVGVKQDTMYWCIASLDDGHVDTIRRICKESVWSYVTTKDNIIYISCHAGVNDDDTGVYGFDILNPSQCKYKYKHERLQRPRSIVINEDGNIFVGNGLLSNSCIHQLTASCQLVDIFTQGIPRYLHAMFWNNRRLYVTRWGSHDITVFQRVYQGSHKASEDLASHERKQPGIVEFAIQIAKGNVDNGQSSVETEIPPSRTSPEDSEDEKQENHTDSEVPISNEGNELVIEGTTAQIGHEIVDNGQSSVDTERPSSGPSPDNSEDDTQGNQRDLEVPISDEGKQPVIEVTSTQIGQEIPIEQSVEEELNQAGIKMSTEERDLFIKFQNEIGTDIYFSKGPHRSNDGHDTITATETLFEQNHLDMMDKWLEYKSQGKLTLELIDVIFAQERNQELHENKDDFLNKMEQLNIIVKARFFNENGVKVDNGQSSVGTEEPPSRPSPEDSEEEKQGNHTDSEVSISDKGKQPVIEGTSIQMGQTISFEECVEENLNQAGIKMSTEERDLFIKFQNEIETHIYFSKGPHRLNDGQETRKATDTFFKQTHPDMEEKWLDYKSQGKLTPELIDQNPEKDTSFIECIKESNFRKIGLFLKRRMIPSRSTIIHAIKEHGYNKGIQCLLRGMSTLLRKQVPNAIRVWSGYRTEDLHTPVFVVMFSKKTFIPEKMKFLEPYEEYEIVFRNEHTPNDEEEQISEQSEVHANAINKEDMARVMDCIAKNTERLMNEHSNLSIIAASTVKSMGFNGCLSKRKLVESMCIVLYVPFKGIIPVGEKEFLRDIDGISTDVREGEFVFHGRKEARKWHPKLPMGCRISTRNQQSGTLGGFVDLPGGKTGCITAAHVVLNKTERKNYVKFKKAKKARYNASLAKGQTIIELYQPTCKRAAFGKVSQIAFEEGNKFAPSVDAAVIEITDHDRTPYTGMFPSGNYPVLGFTKENPMMYNSGKTLDHSNISRGSRVVKYGCSTNITHGKLVWNGASVRIVNTGGKSWNRLKADNISYPKFFNQMVVKSSDKINFSMPGDSGALVFKYHSTSRDLNAIGLLIGGSTHRSSVRMHIVTPIQAVFQQLGLENVMFKRFPDINQGEQNLPMNELISSRQRPEIPQEISDTRINELKEEIKEALKEEIREATKLEMNAIKEEIKETTKLEIKEEIKEATQLEIKEEIKSIKSEIKEMQEAVRANNVSLEQIKANTCSLEQTIIRLLSRPGGDAEKT